MIIAITGYKQSGKDTIADYLIKQYGFSKKSFATPIKEAVKEVFGWSEEHVNGALKEVIDPEWGVSPRQMMQWVGTEAFQMYIQRDFPLYSETIGRGLWVKKLCRDIDIANTSKNIVIPDLRFYHEYEELRKYGVFILKVQRDNVDQNDVHLSEREIENIPVEVIIENNTTYEELYEGVDTCMKYFCTIDGEEIETMKEGVA